MRYSIEAAAPSTSGYVTFFPRLFISLLTLAFLAAGIGLFVQHVGILRTWQPAEATIVRSEVIEFRNSKQRSMYRGEVELAYVVGSRGYQTPETFQHASSSESSIRRQMETTYARGTRHRIFVDPDNPYSLRWDVGINFTFFLLPITFTGVGLILIGVCYFLWRLPYPPKLACSRCGTRGASGDRYCPRCGDALKPVDPSPVPHCPVTMSDEADDPDEDDFEIPPPEPRRENPRALLLVGAFFTLPGLGCLLGAAYLGWTTYVATELWPTAEATVTAASIAAQRSGDGTPSYQLAIEFKHGVGPQAAHAAGRSLYASSSYPWIVKRLERFAVGSKHTVRVNPRDPAVRFDVESPLLNWMPTAGLGLFGGIFAAIGLGLMTWGLRRRCSHCRHQIVRGESFCGGCGEAISG